MVLLKALSVSEVVTAYDKATDALFAIAADLVRILGGRRGRPRLRQRKKDSQPMP